MDGPARFLKFWDDKIGSPLFPKNLSAITRTRGGHHRRNRSNILGKSDRCASRSSIRRHEPPDHRLPPTSGRSSVRESGNCSNVHSLDGTAPPIRSNHPIVSFEAFGSPTVQIRNEHELQGIGQSVGIDEPWNIGGFDGGLQNCLLWHLTSSMIVVSDPVIGARLAPSVCVTPGSWLANSNPSLIGSSSAAGEDQFQTCYGN